jgi:hypothetical protein
MYVCMCGVHVFIRFVESGVNMTEPGFKIFEFYKKILTA